MDSGIILFRGWEILSNNATPHTDVRLFSQCQPNVFTVTIVFSLSINRSVVNNRRNKRRTRVCVCVSTGKKCDLSPCIFSRDSRVLAAARPSSPFLCLSQNAYPRVFASTRKSLRLVLFSYFFFVAHIFESELRNRRKRSKYVRLNYKIFWNFINTTTMIFKFGIWRFI